MEQEPLEGMEEHGEPREAYVFEAYLHVELPQGMEADFRLPPVKLEAYNQAGAENKFRDMLEDAEDLNLLLEQCKQQAPSSREWGDTHPGPGFVAHGVRDPQQFLEESRRAEALASEMINFEGMKLLGFHATVFTVEGRDQGTISS